MEQQGQVVSRTLMQLTLKMHFNAPMCSVNITCAAAPQVASAASTGQPSGSIIGTAEAAAVAAAGAAAAALSRTG